MIKLAITGSLGRMGKSITRFALKDPDFHITTLLEQKDHPQIGEIVQNIPVSSDVSSIKESDVLIDFTSPQGTMENLKQCVEHGIGIVIGTTGLTNEQANEIKKASELIPIVFSSNMSVGVNIVFKLTQIAAKKTAQNYTIDIVEAHHIHKKDAPSGTAKTIAKIAENASGNKVEDIESIREGEIVGDHSIRFESEEDIITISHHAKSRDIFAKGALIAAKFLKGKKTGLFNMQNVLGLN